MSDPLIQRLDISAHPRLEKSLGYQANHRWVAWHWEPEINQAMYTDGKTAGASNSLAWQVFLEHPQMRSDLQIYNLAEAEQYWLLLDRKTRNLYVGEGKIVQGLLETPESLGLLACLDGNNNYYRDTRYAIGQLTRFKPWRRWLKLVPIGIGAALVAAVGINTWSRFSPEVEKVAEKPVSITPVSPMASCGVGGSGDLSRYITSSSSPKEVHLVGVYEANSNHRAGYHPSGQVEVKVTRQDKPIILALSSYEPVEWNIQLEPGVVVEKVILNGYHDQKVIGISGIPIEEYSYEETGRYLGNFTYEWESSPALVKQLNQLTGNQLTSFQGCYRGTQFEIQ